MTKTLIVMLAVVLMGVSQVSATLYPDVTTAKDTHVNLDAPDELCSTGTSISLQNNANTDYINFLMFDLSAMNPLETVIISATLTTNQRVDHTVDTYFVVKEVADDTWSETTMTAGTSPTRGPVIGNVSMNNAGGSASTWLTNTLDITAYVQANIDLGDYNISLCYDLPGYSTPTANGSPYYRSIGGTNDGFPSPWGVDYQLGVLDVVAEVPEPMTLMVLGLGLAGFLAGRRK